MSQEEVVKILKHYPKGLDAESIMKIGGLTNSSVCNSLRKMYKRKKILVTYTYQNLSYSSHQKRIYRLDPEINYDE